MQYLPPAKKMTHRFDSDKLLKFCNDVIDTVN